MNEKQKTQEMLENAFKTQRIKSMTEMAIAQRGLINNIVFRMMHEQTKLPVGEVINYLEKQSLDMSNIKEKYHAKISV